VHDLLEEGAEQARAWCEDRARGSGGRPALLPDQWLRPATLEAAGISQPLAG